MAVIWVNSVADPKGSIPVWPPSTSNTASLALRGPVDSVESPNHPEPSVVKEHLCDEADLVFVDGEARLGIDRPEFVVARNEKRRRLPSKNPPWIAGSRVIGSRE
jgi:hypothetical protein